MRKTPYRQLAHLRKTMDMPVQANPFRGYDAVQFNRQYLALLEAVGSPNRARKLAEDVIVWPTGERPDLAIYIGVERDWDEGKRTPDPDMVRKMKQRLMANEEWGNRDAIRAVREALVKMADDAADGNLEVSRQVALKYLADGVAMMTRDTSQAFGTPKPTPTQIGQLVINAGQKPKRREKLPLVSAPPRLGAPQIIDAEVTEIASGS